MIKEAGYIITPEDFQELLDEAARYLDIPEKKGASAAILWRLHGNQGKWSTNPRYGG
jgi:hypothetical protein